MERYSVIKEKNSREIVLLRGKGCVYKKCTFCDYYEDACADETENFLLNRSVLDRVTGIYGELEIINSGSVFELDEQTVSYIKEVCRKKKIDTLHFEAHYIFEKHIPRLRKDFEDFKLKMKIGLESFDYEFREKVLMKGIKEDRPERISQNFDEANFLFGIAGQTRESMEKDIELGLTYFERICVNIMTGNTAKVKPDKDVIKIFLDNIYPKYKDDYRIDILLNNTDFGVGSND